MAGIRKRLKLWHVAVAIPVVCGLGGWIATAITERNARAEVEREAAKLKALGIPTTPGEFVRNVPLQQNAAPIYQRALTVSKALGSTKIQSFRGTSIKPEELVEYRRYVIDQAPALDLVREASEKPDCSWNRDWSLGPLLLLPEYAELKGFGKLAASRAYLEAESGNYEASMQWLMVGRRVASHAREPILIACLVSVAIDSIMLNEFQQQLCQYGDKPAFRVAAAKFLEQPVPLPSVREGMKGEVMLVRTTMAGIEQGRKGFDPSAMFGFGTEPDAQTKAYMYAFRFPFVRAAIEAKSLKRYREMFEAIGEGGFKKEQQVMADLDTKIIADRSLLGTLAGIFYPVFAQAGQAMTRLEAQRRISKAALDIWDLKAKAGVFPKAFTASVDPFTDKPLVYKKAGDRFQLYSVGANKTDDGGMAKPGKPRTDDVEFRWPTP